MNNPRYFLDPKQADFENPQGIVLNAGRPILVGNVVSVLKRLGIPPHQLLQQYRELRAPHFRAGRDIAQGLWRFPREGWDILLTTRFTQIDPFDRQEYGIESVPYTDVMAFPSGQEPLEWVLYRDSGR